MNAPAAFVLTRQKLRALKDDRAYGDVENGGYLLTRRENATLTLLASGSEVTTALKVGCILARKNSKHRSIGCGGTYYRVWRCANGR